MVFSVANNSNNISTSASSLPASNRSIERVDPPEIKELTKLLKKIDHALLPGSRSKLWNEISDTYYALSYDSYFAEGGRRDSALQTLQLYKARLNEYFLSSIFKFNRRAAASPKEYKPVYAEFEKYILHVGKNEFLTQIYLFTQVYFNTEVKNDRAQSPVQTYTLRSGECDDISAFIYHFAQKKGIPGELMLLERADSVPKNRIFHMLFLHKEKSGSTMIDQQYSVKTAYTNGGQIVCEHFKNTIFPRWLIVDPKPWVSGENDEAYCVYLMEKELKWHNRECK